MDPVASGCCSVRTQGSEVLSGFGAERGVSENGTCGHVLVDEKGCHAY